MATHEDLSRTHAAKASSNRAFGWVFTAVFLLVGSWPLLTRSEPRYWALVLGGIFLATTLAAPALLSLPNRLWLRFGLLLNRLISPIVLLVLFYVVVTPMGVLMRVFGQNNLRPRRDRAAQSYWINRDPPGPKADSMRNQF